jgi:hypothetical protein
VAGRDAHELRDKREREREMDNPGRNSPGSGGFTVRVSAGRAVCGRRHETGRTENRINSDQGEDRPCVIEENESKGNIYIYVCVCVILILLLNSALISLSLFLAPSSLPLFFLLSGH